MPRKRRMAGPIEPADLAHHHHRHAARAAVRAARPHHQRGSGHAVVRTHPTGRRNGQIIPLDPAVRHHATVGGVIASNSSGPRRRLYGTARDLVIGMKFATLEGKLVQSGGMVVKNVAGLDMAQAHDRVVRHAGGGDGGEFQADAGARGRAQLPAAFDSLAKAIAARDGVLKSVLQPSAVDLLNPTRPRTAGQPRLAAGVPRRRQRARSIERYEREFAAVGRRRRARRRAAGRAVAARSELHAALPRSSTRMAWWCAPRVR